jgi:hypothetical protein
VLATMRRAGLYVLGVGVPAGALVVLLWRRWRSVFHIVQSEEPGIESLSQPHAR